MNKIDAYKKIDSLNEEILKYKKVHGLFVVGDPVYYSPNVILKKAKFRVHRVDEVIIDKENVDFLVSDDRSEGYINIKQIFKLRKDAVADYNKKLEVLLKELVFERLLSEKDRLEFIILSKPFGEVFIDKDVKELIVREIIDGDEDDKRNIFDNLYQKLKAE